MSNPISSSSSVVQGSEHPLFALRDPLENVCTFLSPRQAAQCSSLSRTWYRAVNNDPVASVMLRHLFPQYKPTKEPSLLSQYQGLCRSSSNLTEGIYLTKHLSLGNEAVVKACFLPDEGMVLGRLNGDIEIRRGTESITLRGHRNSIAALCILRDGKIVSTAKDGLLKVWDLSKVEEERCVITLPAALSKAIIERPDGTLAVGMGSFLQIIDLSLPPADRVIFRLNIGGSIINHLSLLPNEEIIVIDDEGRLTRVTFSQEGPDITGGTNTGGSNFYQLPNEKILSTGNRAFFVWNFSQGTAALTYPYTSGSVVCALSDSQVVAYHKGPLEQQPTPQDLNASTETGCVASGKTWQSLKILNLSPSQEHNFLGTTTPIGTVVLGEEFSSNGWFARPNGKLVCINSKGLHTIDFTPSKREFLLELSLEFARAADEKYPPFSTFNKFENLSPSIKKGVYEQLYQLKKRTSGFGKEECYSCGEYAFHNMHGFSATNKERGVALIRYSNTLFDTAALLK